MEQSSIIQLVSNLGFGGVLVWYCWYVTTTTLPKLVEQFRSEAISIRAEAAAERAEQARVRAEIAAGFAETAAKEREHQTKQLDRVLAEHQAFAESLSKTMSEMVNHCRSRVAQ